MADPRVDRPTIYEGDGPPPCIFLDSEEVEALVDLLDVLDDEWGHLGEPQQGSHRDVLRRATREATNGRRAGDIHSHWR